MKKELKQKRKLERDEVVLCRKVIDGHKSRVDYLEYMVEYYNLMLEKGLMRNYEDKVREFKRLKGDVISELDVLKKLIEQVEDQMRNGVEVKKKDTLDEGNKVEKEVED